MNNNLDEKELLDFYEQISQSLSINASTARSKYARAIQQLRKIM